MALCLSIDNTFGENENKLLQKQIINMTRMLGGYEPRYSKCPLYSNWYDDIYEQYTINPKIDPRKIIFCNRCYCGLQYKNLKKHCNSSEHKFNAF